MKNKIEKNKILKCVCGGTGPLQETIEKQKEHFNETKPGIESYKIEILDVIKDLKTTLETTLEKIDTN